MGDIYFDNFLDSTLDNRIFYDAFDDQSLSDPDDVSMAMGWDFSLAVGETALLSFVISEDFADMLGGIVLAQTDVESNRPYTFPVL